MSIHIPSDRPLTDEEREHLQHWNPRRLEIHDRMFPEASEEVFTDPDEDDETPPYLEWSVKDLLAEIEARGLKPTGSKKKDLADALDKHDAENAEE